MARAWFEYKGVNSRDMHLHIENDISFPTPEADLEFVEVLGRDGDLVIDNKRLKSVSFSLPVRLITPPGVSVEETATRIGEWLRSDVGWSPLRFSGTPEFDYIAISYEQFDIQETLTNYGRTVLTFTLKPYKRKRGADKGIIMSQEQVLTNPYRTHSSPLIQVQGDGNIEIKLNHGRWIELKNVDGSISIDSELMEVYKGNTPQYSKMTNVGTFPKLQPGMNMITWTGDVRRITITPRWETIT